MPTDAGELRNRQGRTKKHTKHFPETDPQTRHLKPQFIGGFAGSKEKSIKIFYFYATF